MQILPGQAERVADGILRAKLVAALAEAVPDFGALTVTSRGAFLDACLAAARARGLRTEQGLGAYALGAWFLEPGFEQRSPRLTALLASDYPEPRKLHAMNEWVSAALGTPDDAAPAEARMREAFYETEAWGRGPARSA